MKTTLNCDSVFEVLTRGPFPSGSADDEGVERHLAACHECRRLAEALQPAVALFHETLANNAGESLPEYRGRLSHAPKAARVRTAAIDAVHRRKPARRNPVEDPESTTRLVRGASAGLLALSLLLLVWTAGSLVGRGGKPSTPHAFGPMKSNLGAASYLALVSLEVPARCMPWESAEAARAAKNLNIHCCTECHSAAHPRMEVCHAAWSNSCVKCHEAGAPTRSATKTIAVARQACEVCHDG